MLALVRDGLNLTCRSSCKKLPTLAGDDNSHNEEGGPGREGLRDREKRSRSGRRIEVKGRSGEGVRVRENRSRSVRGGAQSRNDEWVDQDSGSSVNGNQGPKFSKKRMGSRSVTLGDHGSTSTSRSSERGEVPVQRSMTSNNLRATGEEATSSSSRPDCSDDFKVEMEVLMRLSNGRMVTTKYKVSCQTLMQSVIIKVG